MQENKKGCFYEGTQFAYWLIIDTDLIDARDVKFVGFLENFGNTNNSTNNQAVVPGTTNLARIR